MTDEPIKNLAARSQHLDCPLAGVWFLTRGTLQIPLPTPNYRLRACTVSTPSSSVHKLHECNPRSFPCCWLLQPTSRHDPSHRAPIPAEALPAHKWCSVGDAPDARNLVMSLIRTWIWFCAATNTRFPVVINDANLVVLLFFHSEYLCLKLLIGALKKFRPGQSQVFMPSQILRRTIKYQVSPCPRSSEHPC
jgi:hypothetical protein